VRDYVAVFFEDYGWLGLNSKWVVGGLVYLVFRLYGRVQAHETKINQLCKKAEIEPIAPEQK